MGRNTEKMGGRDGMGKEEGDKASSAQTVVSSTLQWFHHGKCRRI